MNRYERPKVDTHKMTPSSSQPLAGELQAQEPNSPSALTAAPANKETSGAQLVSEVLQAGHKIRHRVKTMAEIVETAREGMRQLTGLKLSSTVGLSKTDTGWSIQLELVEKESLPDAMDVLARYEVSVDGNGHVLEFKRKALRKRIEIESPSGEEF